jgi:ATP-dependent DNA ligase
VWQGAEVTLPVRPPVSPMLAKLSRELPTGDGWLYEPKWDGFRCIVFRDGDDVELGSRNEKSLTRYFPEILDPLRASLPEQAVVDGELVIATDRGLDFDLLSNRIHPAERRVAKLAGETPVSFVAFDLLAVMDTDLRPVAFSERRKLLEKSLGKATSPVYLTPVTTDAAVAADWFDHFEGAGLDGVVAKPLGEPYREGKRTMLKVKHQRTADVVVAGYRVHKDGNGVGSFLLGLYDAAGTLHHVGVASNFAAEARAEMTAELAPLERDALVGHPWREWQTQDAEAPSEQRMPGAPSRWNAKKDMSWVPLRIERVAEVAFEHMQGDRFRHNARFVRWRPDRDPSSCTYEQLDVPVPVELREVFGL